MIGTFRRTRTFHHASKRAVSRTELRVQLDDARKAYDTIPRSKFYSPWELLLVVGGRKQGRTHPSVGRLSAQSRPSVRPSVGERGERWIVAPNDIFPDQEHYSKLQIASGRASERARDIRSMYGWTRKNLDVSKNKARLVRQIPKDCP